MTLAILASELLRVDLCTHRPILAHPYGVRPERQPAA
jgi:hypothetical protein